jgi:cardiolipin synthase A/B
MLAEVTGAGCNWLSTGDEVFPAMLAAIDAAQQSVRLETYIFAAGALGDRFRDALVRARKRDVRVRVLVDALGSYSLPSGYWLPLTNSGGEARVFNPISLHRVSIRNHRKLLVCDDRVAFVGGFNIAPEYEGDGVTSGWCDLGLRIEGPLAAQLAASFEQMFALARFEHKPFRPRRVRRTVYAQDEQLLLSGPGWGPSPIQRSFRRDIARAQSVRIVSAYFLPTWRLRHQLASAARRGGMVELLLAGKSDVSVSQLAGRSLYRRLLKAGVQICEYQPQILHAKLVIVDDAVYVGSANFDLRSFQFNYELMVRFQNKEMAARARELFQKHQGHSRVITLEDLRKSRTWWQRFKQRWAYFLLVRIDPYIARRQWRSIPD